MRVQDRCKMRMGSRSTCASRTSPKDCGQVEWMYGSLPASAVRTSTTSRRSQGAARSGAHDPSETVGL